MTDNTAGTVEAPESTTVEELSSDDDDKEGLPAVAETKPTEATKKPLLPLAPMFLPPQERLAALKRREAELEAAKVTETSERPRKERKARKPSEKGKGKAKETANTTEDAEEEERKLVTQEREAEVSPEATEETVIEEEGGLLGETMGKSPPPEKKTVPLAPIFAPKSERLRMAAEKKLAEEKGAVEETRGGRKRRVSRVGLEQGSHRLSNDPVGQVKYVIEDASEEDDEPPPPPRRRKQVARAKPKARNRPRRSPESESEYSTSEAESVLPPPPPPKVVLTEYSAAPLKVAGSSKSTGPVFGIFSGRSSASSQPSRRSEVPVELKGVSPSPFCGSINYIAHEQVDPPMTPLWSSRPSHVPEEAPEMLSRSSAEVPSTVASSQVVGKSIGPLPSWDEVRRDDIEEAVGAMMVPRDARAWSAPLEPQDTHQWLAARIPSDRMNAHEDCRQYHKNWNRHHLLPPSARHKHALAKWLKLWVKRADTARDRRRMEAATTAVATAAASKRLRKAGEAAATSSKVPGAPEADDDGWIQKKGSKGRTNGSRGLRRQMCYGCDGSVLVFEPPSKSRGKRGRRQSDTSDAEGVVSGPTYTPFGCSVVITGGTGCGKTSLVYAAAREAGVAVVELSVDSCPPGHTVQVGLMIEEAIKSSSVDLRGSQPSVASSSDGKCSPSPEGDAPLNTGLLQLLLVDDVDAIVANDRSYGSLFGQLIAASRRPVVFTARSVEDLPRQLRPQPIRRREIIEFWDDLDSSPLLVQSSPQQLPIPRPSPRMVMAVALQLAEALYGADVESSDLPPPSSCTDFRRATLEVEASRRVEAAAVPTEGGEPSTLLFSSQQDQLTLEDLSSVSRLQSAVAAAAWTEPQQPKESEVVEALRCLEGNLRVSNKECQTTVIPLAMHMLAERDLAGTATTRRTTRENATELFKMWTERQRVRMGPAATLKRCLAQEAVGVLLELYDRYPSVTTIESSRAEPSEGSPSDTDMETTNSQAGVDYPPPGD